MLRGWQVVNLAQAFNVQYSGQVEGLAKLARLAVGAQKIRLWKSSFGQGSAQRRGWMATWLRKWPKMNPEGPREARMARNVFPNI